jgi:uncharacterized C2H2 Zn-finger protein
MLNNLVFRELHMYDKHFKEDHSFIFFRPSKQLAWLPQLAWD